MTDVRFVIEIRDGEDWYTCDTVYYDLDRACEKALPIAREMLNELYDTSDLTDDDIFNWLYEDMNVDDLVRIICLD